MSSDLPARLKALKDELVAFTVFENGLAATAWSAETYVDMVCAIDEAIEKLTAARELSEYDEIHAEALRAARSGNGGPRPGNRAEKA